MQSFRAARRPNAAGLSLSSRASDAKYFDLIFFAELRSSQYLLLRWCSRGYDTRREHCTLPGTIICANFSFTFCRLAVCQYTWRWDTLGAQSFGVRCWISHPVFPAVHDYCQRLKYILLCCNLRYYLLSHSTESRQAGYFLACISLMNFWTEVPLGQGLYIQEPRHSSRTFSQPHAVCTPPNLSSIYWILLRVNQLRAIAMFAFTQLLSIWAAFMLPLSSHCTHSVAPALRHTYATAILPQHLEDVMRKKPKDLRDGVTMRVSMEIWDSCSDLCKIVYMQKAAALQGAWAQRSVRRGATGKVSSTR